MPTPHDELSAFASALAARLPGTWTSAPPQVDDASCSLMTRVWDVGHILWAAGYDSMLHVLLDGPDGQQLCVFKRPVGRGGEFLVTPMYPTGFKPHQVSSVDAPNGIVVPDNPLRAAADGIRRVLPRYEAAFGAVRHHARIQPEPPHSRAERALFLHAAVRLLTTQGMSVNIRNATPAAPTPPPARPLTATTAPAAQPR
ncbi:hypothetical protein [Streptomyces prunicolor]|uniref:hypothetical protein n=1 Tax=Streptomyces prunicolor TaxID=67348 RepID=UPI0033E633EA